jgi:hypothetical protein
MYAEAKVYLDDVRVTVSMEVEAYPYRRATWDYPAEGGIEDITDVIVIDADDETLIGLTLSSEQVRDLYNELAQQATGYLEGDE